MILDDMEQSYIKTKVLEIDFYEILWQFYFIIPEFVVFDSLLATMFL